MVRSSPALGLGERRPGGGAVQRVPREPRGAGHHQVPGAAGADPVCPAPRRFPAVPATDTHQIEGKGSSPGYLEAWRNFIDGQIVHVYSICG